MGWREIALHYRAARSWEWGFGVSNCNIGLCDRAADVLRRVAYALQRLSYVLRRTAYGLRRVSYGLRRVSYGVGGPVPQGGGSILHGNRRP
ncbi:MAG: hypothetical protein QOD99_1063 [Chthoniobacter sp.]|nr:hypothetical protein [Chthoniobacter sp.]